LIFVGVRFFALGAKNRTHMVVMYHAATGNMLFKRRAPHTSCYSGLSRTSLPYATIQPAALGLAEILMDSTQFQQFTAILQHTLSADQRVRALVGIGWLAQPERIDRWSDHDFWVITTLTIGHLLVTDLQTITNT
jgi:hypothetical protein